MTAGAMLDISLIVQRVQDVTWRGKVPIGLHEPLLRGNEWTYVKECLDIGWVSSAGKFVDRFEAELAAYTGAKYAVAAVNGTAALHTCLMLAGVERDDEVLIPALTFVATANAVAYCGAVPHFVDSQERTLGVDPRKLGDHLKTVAEVQNGGCYNRSTGRRIRAVVPMHTFGHPVDIDPLLDICREYKIVMIEDAAESLGSLYRGRHTGTFGVMAALSFNGNKTITTGGGGAILTNDEALARAAKHLTTTAKLPHTWEFRHDQVGYNYRMPNINAALGCGQLEQLPGFLEKKRALANRYHDAFTGLPGVSCFSEPDFARSNYWLNVIVLDDAVSAQRDLLLQRFHSEGILARPAWTLMHKLSMFSQCPRMDLSTAEKLERTLINLPSSAFLGGVDAAA